ncbi:MAG: hypothetical protein U1E65_12735 [Myxococcota bacterium]
MSTEGPETSAPLPRSKEELLRETLELEDAAHRATDKQEAVGMLLRAAQLRRDGLGDLEGARMLCRRAVQLLPEHRSALNRFTQLLVQAERWDELVDVLELSAKAAKDDEEKARVLAHRGDVLGRRLARLAEARSMYREVARLTADQALREAAEQAVVRLEQLLENQGKKVGRERTYVGRVKGLSELPPPPASIAPGPPIDRAQQLVLDAMAALDAGRVADARILVEQCLALRPWNAGALDARRAILKKEGRFDDLLRLLVAESEEAPEPKIACAALVEAVEVAADALSDVEGALVLSRRLLMQFPEDDEVLARVAFVLAKKGRFDIGRRLLPDLTADARADRFVSLAMTRDAVGARREAQILYAIAYDDRPDELMLFESRVQVLSELPDSPVLEATLKKRLSVTPDPDERRALVWELVSRAEAQGRLKDGALALVDFIHAGGRPGDVSEALSAVDRIALQLNDRGLLVRAHEVSVQTPGLSDAELARRWAALARFRRDELWDVEGAELALVRASALGLDVGLELAELRRGITAMGVDSIPPRPAAILDDRTLEMEGPLAAGMGELGPEPITEERPRPQLTLKSRGEEPTEELGRAPPPPEPAPPSPPPEAAAAAPTASEDVETAPDDLRDLTEAAKAVLVDARSFGPEGPLVAACRAATFDEALEEARAQVEILPPADAASWLRLGAWALELERLEDAEPCFDRGIAAAEALGARRALAAILEDALARSGARERPEHKVLLLDDREGPGLAVRAKALGELFGIFEAPALESAWIEAAAAADPASPTMTEAWAAILEARGERAELLELWARGGVFIDRRAEGRRALRLADACSEHQDLPSAARAIARAMLELPLEIEPARRLVELGLAGQQLEWVAEGSRELRERYLWATDLGPATAVALVRAALDLDDADDRLLVAYAARRPQAPAREGEDANSERGRLRRLIAARDRPTLAAALDPSTEGGHRLLLTFFSPSFLLSDLG